jgi:hypothetical protein
VFTFSCPTCHKQHCIDEPFTESFEMHCFRCQALIQVTKKIIRIDHRSQQLARPTTPTPVATESIPSLQVPTRTGGAGRRKWLAGGLVTTSLLCLGVGFYVVFGGGILAEKKKSTLAASPKSTNVVASLPNRTVVQPGLNLKANPAKEISPKMRSSSDSVTSSKNASYVRRPLAPLEIVREAVEKRFGNRVVVSTVWVENGNLTLEGELLRWEDLRPAREVAVHALEAAGFGPIRSWDNHLKKTKQ